MTLKIKCDNCFLYLNFDANFPNIKFPMTTDSIGVCIILQPTGKHNLLIQSCKQGLEDMAQQLRTLTAFAENLGSNPITHIQQLASTCNSSFKESCVLLASLGTHSYACTCIHTCTHRLKNNYVFKRLQSPTRFYASFNG